MKQALLLVSFGTAAPGAQNSITAVENALIAAAPDRAVFRAYTSPTIRRILARRGVEMPDLTTALETLAAQGYEDVAFWRGIFDHFTNPYLRYFLDTASERGMTVTDCLDYSGMYL